MQDAVRHICICHRVSIGPGINQAGHTHMTEHLCVCKHAYRRLMAVTLWLRCLLHVCHMCCQLRCRASRTPTLHSREAKVATKRQIPCVVTKTAPHGGGGKLAYLTGCICETGALQWRISAANVTLKGVRPLQQGVAGPLHPAKFD